MAHQICQRAYSILQSVFSFFAVCLLKLYCSLVFNLFTIEMKINLTHVVNGGRGDENFYTKTILQGENKKGKNHQNSRNKNGKMQ